MGRHQFRRQIVRWGSGITLAGLALTPSFQAAPPASALVLEVQNTSGNPAVAGSLPNLVASASDGDEITFDPSVTGTITLDSTLNISNKTLTITGPGAGTLALTTGTGAIIDFDSFGLPKSLAVSGLELKDASSVAFEAAGRVQVSLDDMLFTGNGAGMTVDGLNTADPETLSVTDTDFVDTVGRAIATGTVFSPLDDVDITGVTISDPGDVSTSDGIYIEDAIDVSIEGTTVVDQAADGIRVFLGGNLSGAEPISMTNVTVERNGGDGIDVVAVKGPVTIDGSVALPTTASDNVGHGIRLSQLSDAAGSDDIIVADVVADGNDRSGVFIESAGSVDVDDVSADGNGESGLTANVIDRAVTIDDSTFQNTTSTSVNAAGLLLTNVRPVGATLTNVVVSNNASQGLGYTAGGSAPITPNGPLVVTGTNSFVGNTQNGIRVLNGTSVSVSDATATGNSTGLNVGTATSVVVSGSTFDDSDLTGASLLGVADSVQISNTSMSDNTLDGLLVRPGGSPQVTTTSVTLTSVQADDNPSLGADITATGPVTISGSSSFDGNGSVPQFPSVGYGLSVDTQGAVSLGDASIDGNGDDGLRIESAGSLTTDGASIDGNGEHGILIESITGTSTVTGGTISGNVVDGVNVQPITAGADAGDITFDGVTFDANPIGLDFNSGGVGVVASADALTINGSTFTGHTGHAIDVGDPGAVTIDDTGVLNGLGSLTVGDGVNISGATSVSITDLTVADQDGGLSVLGTAGDVSITGGSVTGSVAGGVGINGVTGTTTVNGLVASGNGTGAGVGSLTGLSIVDAAGVSISDVVADGNPTSGISVSNAGAIAVTGGSTDDNQTGLAITNTNGDVSIDGLTADDNSNLGITVTSGFGTPHDVSIANSTADDNVTFGAVLTSVGDVDITSTNTRRNGSDGVRISTADAVTVDGLNSSSNGGGIDADGLDVTDVDAFDITDATLTDNEAGGLAASDIGGDVTIATSMITGNDAEGAAVRQIDGSVEVSETTASNNGDDGIWVSEATGVTLGDVTISGNGHAGLDLDDPGPVALDRATVTENYLVAAPVSDGTGVDIAGATELSVDGGSISDNGATGLSATVTGPVSLLGATVADNGGSGAVLLDVGALSIERLLVTGNAGQGVLAVDPTTVDITDATIEGNTTNGVSLNGPTGPTTVASSDFDDNTGAGLAVTSGTGPTGAVVVDASSFAGNKDGVRLDGGTSLTVTDSTFSDQVTSAVSVGGSTGAITVADTRMTGNGSGLNVRASTGDVTLQRSNVVRGGQGIELDDVTGSLLVESVGMTGNGGGLRADTVTGSITIDRSALYSNGPAATTSSLDLVRVTDVAGGVEFVNSTVALNRVLRLIDASATPVTIRHSTFSENSSFAIANTDTDVTIDHSIVEATGEKVLVESTAVAPAPQPTLVATHSIVPLDSGLGGSTIELTSANLTPGIVSDEASYAHVPNNGSPAIDAGNPAISGQPATDQRGDARIVDVIDIGSIEAIPGAPALISLEPARFVDTRAAGETLDGQFEGEGKRAAESEYTVTIAGRGGVPTDAAGVVMNVTAIAAEGTGFVTVHPCVSPRPLSSSLNYGTGVNLGNELIAGLSDDGTTCLFTNRAAHLTVDVTGYIPAGSSTTPTTPARFLDTRAVGETVDAVAQGDGRTTAGGTIELDVAGRGDIPGDAKAVIVNVTAVGAQGTGFVTVHPCVDPIPLASSLNFVAGVNRGNELVASLDATGKVCIFTSASIHVTADVVGYLPADSTVASVDPARLLDTRGAGETVDDIGAGAGKVGPDDEVTVQMTGRAGVPDDATAVVVNVTAIGAESTGFVTVHPCADPRPLASSLNYVAGVNGGNEIVALLNPDGELCLYSSARTHLAVDVVAYLSPV